MRHVVAVALVGCALLPLHARAATIDLADLLQRAGEYVRRVERDFTSVVSDEDYVQQQQVTQRATQVTRSSSRRRLRSQMLFLWAGQDRSWISARDVLAVDGHPVPDNTPHIAELFRTADVAATRETQARLLRDQGVRFDIGRIGRSFADPTLVLQFLEPQSQARFLFRSVSSSRVAGRDVVAVAYQEIGRPTALSSSGNSLPASGTLYIAADDGTVVKADIHLTDELYATEGTLKIEYRADATLGVWVPARMEEAYVQHRSSFDDNQNLIRTEEHVTCTATYSNYRRLDSSGRLAAP